jgi:hypothetical protein
MYLLIGYKLVSNTCSIYLVYMLYYDVSLYHPEGVTEGENMKNVKKNVVQARKGNICSKRNILNTCEGMIKMKILICFFACSAPKTQLEEKRKKVRARSDATLRSVMPLLQTQSQCRHKGKMKSKAYINFGQVPNRKINFFFTYLRRKFAPVLLISEE